MFEWFHRLFCFADEDKRQRLHGTIDGLNAETGGGKPVRTRKYLGKLQLRSGTLSLGDPQYVPGLEIPNIAAEEVAISVSLWQYPSGAVMVTSLELCLGEPGPGGPRHKIGELGIDTAKLVVADKADIEEHWTAVGKERVGVISTAPDDTVLHMLTERFGLKTVRVNPVRVELVGAVSEALAQEIEEFLKSHHKYADYPFMYFHVQTNNSFDRASYLAREWDFLPIGNADTPLMFVCGTGRGDGCYDVECEFAGDVPRVLSISFMDE